MCGECVHCTASCKYMTDKIHTGWKQVRSTPSIDDPSYEKPTEWIVCTESYTRGGDPLARFANVEFIFLPRYKDDKPILDNDPDFDLTIIGRGATYIEVVRLLAKHLELEERYINSSVLK